MVTICQLLLLIILCFLLVRLSCIKEGYFNNQPPTARPDDIQFYACHDYSNNDNLGNNNYKIKKHGIGEPLQGVYSHFLNKYELRNYDEIFHAPICETQYNFTDINELNNREILDEDDILRKDEIKEDEAEYDKNGIKDPLYLYGDQVLARLERRAYRPW